MDRKPGLRKMKIMIIKLKYISLAQRDSSRKWQVSELELNLPSI